MTMEKHKELIDDVECQVCGNSKHFTYWEDDAMWVCLVCGTSNPFNEDDDDWT